MYTTRRTSCTITAHCFLAKLFLRSRETEAKLRLTFTKSPVHWEEADWGECKLMDQVAAQQAAQLAVKSIPSGLSKSSKLSHLSDFQNVPSSGLEQLRSHILLWKIHSIIRNFFVVTAENGS